MFKPNLAQKLRVYGDVIHAASTGAAGGLITAKVVGAKERPRNVIAAGPVEDQSVAAAYPACEACWAANCLTHSVLTDFGRVIAVPIARLSTSCESMPIARLTLNSTV